jgi:hypothetical protein
MSRSQWPTRLSVSEGMANAKAGGWVSLILVAAVAWVMTAIGVANALEVSTLVRAEQSWIAAGAFVVSVEPAAKDKSAGLIDVAECEGLSRVDGVEASFAAQVTTATIEPANAPGTPTTLTYVSPGAYAFLNAREPQGVGVLATAPAAESTGLADGERTTFTRLNNADAPIAFAATLVVTRSADLSPALLGSFMLPTLLSGQADSCLVRSDAAHASAVSVYLAEALSARDGSLAIVRPLLPKSTYGVDFATAYSSRALGWAWVAGASLLAAMWALVQRTRRSRAAIYQTFGADARARLTMQFTEWTVVSLLGVVWSWGSALTLAIGFGADPSIALAQASLQILIAWCAASLAVIALSLIPVGTILDALKDRS